MNPIILVLCSFAGTGFWNAIREDDRDVALACTVIATIALVMAVAIHVLWPTP